MEWRKLTLDCSRAPGHVHGTYNTGFLKHGQKAIKCWVHKPSSPPRSTRSPCHSLFNQHLRSETHYFLLHPHSVQFLFIWIPERLSGLNTGIFEETKIHRGDLLVMPLYGTWPTERLVVRLVKDLKWYYAKSGWGMGVLAHKKRESEDTRSSSQVQPDKVCVAQWDKTRCNVLPYRKDIGLGRG